MIVVLAGAGASCAVDPQRYPTTTEFFERLPTKISEHKLFAGVTDFIKSKSILVTPIDIELVLYELEELASATTTLTAPQGLFSWLRNNGRTRGIVGKEAGTVDSAMPQMASLHEQTTMLMSDIHRQVYDLYRHLPTKDELEGNWLPLLRGLIERDSRVEVFTTNYDFVIEHAADLGGLPLDSGRTKTVAPTLDVSLWEVSERPRQSLTRGLITKLHGSVDWNRIGDTIHVGTALYGGSHDPHVIIYPGFKGGPLRSPLDRFHHHFESCVADAKALVIVGYAFRDPHINAVLRERTSRDSSVIVINPQEKFEDNPVHARSVSHIKNGFNAEAVAECLEAVSATTDHTTG